MENYTINELIDSAVVNLGKVSEVNNIVGKPFVTADGVTIVPISKLSFAYLVGGGEYGKNKNAVREGVQFAGGSGGGASIQPVGFLVIDKNGVNMINASESSNVEKIIDITKEIFNKGTI